MFGAKWKVKMNATKIINYWKVKNDPSKFSSKTVHRDPGSWYHRIDVTLLDMKYSSSWVQSTDSPEFLLFAEALIKIGQQIKDSEG